MSVNLIKGFVVFFLSLLISFVLFDYYHGSIKYNFVRLIKPHGDAVIYAGEILPATIMLAATIYLINQFKKK